MDAFGPNVKMLDDLAPGELRDGDDRPRPLGRPTGQPPATQTLSYGKPLRVSHERQIMKRHHGRDLVAQRRAVCRGRKRRPGDRAQPPPAAGPCFTRSLPVPLSCV